jgi:hypothetical protein
MKWNITVKGEWIIEKYFVRSVLVLNEVLILHFSGLTEESHEIRQSGHPVYWPKSEQSTSFITAAQTYLNTLIYPLPVTVAARSEAWTVFARSNAGVVGSNPSLSMDACMLLFSVRVFLYVGRGLVTGWSPTKESCRLCLCLGNWKSSQGPPKGCRAIQ